MTMRGFTLIETMIAVTILTIAIAGPLMTANRSIVAAQSARDQLTASYLAQEGIEHVRAIRDNNYLAAYYAGGLNISTTAWNNFLTASVNQCRSAECSLDPTLPIGYGSSSSLYQCSGDNCKLYLLPNGVYATNRSVQTGTGTRFKRTIQIVDIAGTSDIQGSPYPDKRVVSKVSWDFHGTIYSVTIYDHLTPWQ